MAQTAGFAFAGAGQARSQILARGAQRRRESEQKSRQGGAR